MKYIRTIFIFALIAAAGTTWAQEYKVARSTGRLELYIGRVTVEGHSGSEIIFSSSDGKNKDDDRAKGLTPINSMGLTDNTGLGINVSESGDVVKVSQLKRTNSPDIRVLVPKGVIVYFSHSSTYGGTAHFRNMENEIEVSAQYNSVELENVTGPCTIKTVYGHVEADFGGNVKGPLSIVSVYGYADVTLPLATKANLRLDTSYGEIFVAPEFKIEMTGRNGGDTVNGKINGGGMYVEISSNYGKVYLRKK